MTALLVRRALAPLAIAAALGACADPTRPFERGTRILYVGPVTCPPDRAGLSCSAVYSIDPDGGAPVRAAEFDHLSQAAWTLDGTRVAFSQYDYSREYYLARAATVGSTDTVTVAAPSYNYDDLRWSPDGSHLAYHHWDSLCVGSPTGPRDRCFGGFGDRLYQAIGFTPDGASLVARSDSFPAGGGGPWYEGHYLLDVASGTRTKLPLDGRPIRSAATSPAAPMLVFEAPSGAEVDGRDVATFRLYVMSMPSGQPRRLTRIDDAGSQTGETKPRWSPDGRRLTFAVGQTVVYGVPSIVSTDVYVVNADGSGLRRLTTTTGAYPLAWVR